MLLLLLATVEDVAQPLPCTLCSGKERLHPSEQSGKFRTQPGKASAKPGSHTSQLPSRPRKESVSQFSGKFDYFRVPDSTHEFSSQVHAIRNPVANPLTALFPGFAYSIENFGKNSLDFG